MDRKRQNVIITGIASVVFLTALWAIYYYIFRIQEDETQNLFFFKRFCILAAISTLLYIGASEFLKSRIDIQGLLAHRYYIFLPAMLLIVFVMYYKNQDKLSAAGIQLSFLAVMSALFICGLYLFNTGRLDWTKIAVIIIIIGIMLRLCYMFYTGPYIRQHDIQGNWGHIGYMLHIADQFSLPPVGEYQAYHPPVHHIIAAAAIKIGIFFGFDEFYQLRLVQLVMVLLSSISLVYFQKILKLVTANKVITTAALAVFAFHPANIYPSAFLNNDNTLLFFYILAFYYLLKWMKNTTYRNILLLALFTSLSILTKKSAVILLPIIFTVFLVTVLKNRTACKTCIKQITAFCIMAAPLSASFQLRNFILFKQGFGYTPSVPFAPYPNSIHNLFHISFERLLEFPFTGDPFNEFDKNRFFSEYLFKSSLFGEWRFPGLENIAALLITASVAVWVIIAAYLLLSGKDDIKGYGYVFLMNLFIPIVLQFKFRLDYPFVCSQNFRYIAVILISAAYFTGKAVDRFHSTKYPVLKYSIPGCIFAFCALSALFVLKMGVS